MEQMKNKKATMFEGIEAHHAGHCVYISINQAHVEAIYKRFQKLTATLGKRGSTKPMPSISK